jgi:type I restriction-modification system DNA methylase subunit
MVSILGKNKDLPFGNAYCEGQSPNSNKRRDLTLEDHNGRVVLTGEVKLPGKKDGATPYNSKVVEDARAKARRAGVSFFFTWNVNECVLWETEETSNGPRPDYRSWRVANVRDAKELEYPDVQAGIKRWLADFLRDASDALRGAEVIERKSPDEKFIDALEAALRTPVALTFDALYERYRKGNTRREIDDWMRDELGFVIVSDPEGSRDNLDRAAKHSCYALANKLVFYEALLKRYGALLPALNVPEHINTAEQLRTHFEGFFAHAKKVTHDYETVFGEDSLGLGSRVPFYNDGVVEFWRAFVEEIHEFDFSRLDYEVVGNIFERLISPEERRKFGQFYTRAEVVDLINSFAIRSGEEKVMDPACGGGTFLVRAYARKRELALDGSHAQRLRNLYGVDISRFATHLTTVNLATRDLIDEENYPQVARDNFFDVKLNGTLISLPRSVETSGLGKSQKRDVQIPELDAVVGNPPYIRQEEIPDPLKARYQEISRHNGARLTKRSDIHCYFWPHGLSFLKENGYLCFLTSSQWLDTDYGFGLQAWILRNFEIVAVLESRDEPWFVGARVATTITILRRQKDASRRMENVVRFAQLREPMAEIFAHDGTTAGSVRAADRFRDELLGLTENTSNARYRARLVRQGDLWNEGVRLGVAMGKSNPAQDTEANPQPGEYYGGKWGVHLRAPDLWFDLLTRCDHRLTPLGEIAEVRFGVKSGKDSFFFPSDASQEALDRFADPDEFRVQFGAARDEVERDEVKIVRCGEGHEEMRPIESRFLEPEVHSLMGLDRYSVRGEDCPRLVLLVSSDRNAITGTHVLRYIEWGEEQDFHLTPTCQGRITEEREWFDLTHSRRMGVIVPKIQQYRLFTILNEQKYYQASALLGIAEAKGLAPEVIAGVLNSTVSILSRLSYARILGNEGNIQLDVYSAGMMRVPNPRLATEKQQERVAEAFREMKDRPVLGFLSERRLRRMNYTAKGKEEDLAQVSDESELTQSDRYVLDDTVLELLGISSQGERKQILDDLYAYLTEFFEWTRQKEESAIQNKKKAKAGKAVRPAALADEIFAEIEREHGTLLRAYEDFLDLNKPFDTHEIPEEGEPEPLDGLLEEHAIRFLGRKGSEAPIVEARSDAQRELLMLLVKNGVRGLVRLPLEDETSNKVRLRYTNLLHQRAETSRTLIEERTSDPELQEKVHANLMRRF